MQIQNKYLWSLVICFELVLVVFIGYKIIQKKNNTLGFSTAAIKKDTVTVNNIDGLKYFYEPISNRIEIGEASWLKSKPKYYINSDGLNDTLEYKPQKEKGTFRILTLGDSFTFGQFVDTQNNYPKQLANMLNSQLKCGNITKFEVINLGVYGYDIQYSVERYKLKGQKYNPDLILWFLKKDDVEYINELMNQKVNSIKHNLSSAELVDFHKKKNYYPEWTIAGETFVKDVGIKNIYNMQRTFFKQFDELYKGPLVVFTLPYVQEEHRKFLAQYAQNRPSGHYFEGIENIYHMGAVFEDGHPNERGHKIIAKDLFEYLTKNKFIPCQ